MRWLVGWSGLGGKTRDGTTALADVRALRPVGGRLLWPGSDPLWAVGDWRSDEIRSVTLHRWRRHSSAVVRHGFPDLVDDPVAGELPPDDGASARLLVLGRCGAADAALRTALLATSGGALRHLTTWSGSYVVVLQLGSRVSILGDLAGVHPVYHTPFGGGTAYATAALPLADLVDAPLDRIHLAARLALPDAPEGVGDGSPFTGVLRVPPGQALTVRGGVPAVGVYEPVPGGVGSYENSEASATAEVTRSLLESVRLRVRTSQQVPQPAFGVGGLGGLAGQAVAAGDMSAELSATVFVTGPGSAGRGSVPEAGVGPGFDLGLAPDLGLGPDLSLGHGLGMFVGRPHRRGAEALSGSGEGLPDEMLFEGGIGYDCPDEAGELVVRRRDVSVDLSGGSASTVLALLAATIPRVAKVPAARATERPSGAPGSPRDPGSAGLAPGAATGATTAPEPPDARSSESSRSSQSTRRTERATPDGTGAPNGSAPPVRHPALGTFSEERWGDPRSYRTLHHGPPTPPSSSSAGPDAARRTGAVRGSWARRVTAPEAEPTGLLAITWTDAEGATGAPLTPAREAELLRARSVAEAAADRLDHVVVPGGEDALPYADLADDPLAGPLTDEPGPALVAALRHRARLAAAGTDHISGHGARQVLDGHPARLADLLLERRRSPLLRPVAALARADSAMVGTPVAVVRAARRLARTGYTDGLRDAAAALVGGRAVGAPPGTAGEASTRALAWCTPGPAAAWLTADARGAVAQRLHLAARAGAPDERPGARRARLALQRRAAEFRVLAQVVESAPDARGQRLHAPFLDNQVVRACRQVPDRARIQPGARHGILRAVLAGAGVQEVPDGWGNGLPPDPYAAADSVRAGLRRSADALDRLFAASLLGDWGLIDAEGVRAALRAAASDAPAPLDGLADVVAMELWLRRLRARRGSCWTGLPPLPRPAVTSGAGQPASAASPSPAGRAATASASHVS
ncbi:hypothetical protein ABH940_004786 [Streptacidiphilus sp. BW17]|uniref:asparagine synthase-related protein n=1 Tax=Streptacidiphilus sp. BW17 TaxID=3156274 RepID=UPI00351230D2